MLRLVLLLLIGFVLEICVWIGVANFISGWWIFLWTIIAFVVGLNMLRGSVSNIMPQLQQMQATGQMTGDARVSKSLGIAISGFLLLLPGLISDVLAVIILIPAVQKILQGALMSTMQKRQQAMMQQMMGGMGGMGANSDMMAEMMRRMQDVQGGSAGAASSHRPTVIDGEARHVTPEVKQIKAANDDSQS